MWSFVIQRLVFVITYINYLQTGELLPRETVASQLKRKSNMTSIHYVIFDFLLTSATFLITFSIDRIDIAFFAKHYDRGYYAIKSLSSSSFISKALNNTIS